MGTHADIFFLDEDNEPLVRIYSHYDGYPAGRGQDLYNLLSGRWEYDCGGIANEDIWKYLSNGMSDLAALATWYLKKDNLSYNIYLERIYPDWRECIHDTEFVYIIKKCRRGSEIGGLNIAVYEWGSMLYDGDIEGFGRKFSLDGAEALANDAEYEADKAKKREQE